MENIYKSLLRILQLLAAVLLAAVSASANPASGGYQLFERAASGISADIPLAALGNFDYFAKIAPECCNAPNGGVVNRFGPLNEGPLPDDITRTFRSGTYDEVITTEPTTLYRVIGDNGNPAGGYWTRAEPQGPLQSVIDSALDQNWGNSATTVVQMEVPAGTRLFEGVAAPQRGLVGGGNQIYFDRNINPLDPAWIQQ